MSRYIDADAIKIPSTSVDMFENCRNCNLLDEFQVREIIDSAPNIEIVRCQDCKYWVYNFNGCSRNPCTEPWYATDFCNYGEREGE